MPFQKIPFSYLQIESHLTSIGIDLTGSEARASGWCLLKDGRAITKRIKSTAEIISDTINSQPDVVSIDSPLSLPKGRISVYDTDPGRHEFGIMRESERILRKRGIRVYPPLIQSLQKLTERGIEIAAQLREHGLLVIESFPGGAQDILGIPRKHAGVAELARGLQAFGITGDFIDNKKISHDELDAITSALVGYFYLAGQFEALGNEEEGYLIVPKVEI